MLKNANATIVLAEEAVSGRHDPAGGHQGAGAEVQLPNINGHHPGMSTRQSRVSAQYPPPGDGQPLLVPFPADGSFARRGQAGSLNEGRRVKGNNVSG